ncbi:hypothetical protein TCAL_04516 [Tigriopus californicus]|uniref:MPN domain-containing protein n=1 Tax=Tigriopus californicus TaxID=6832 RepID=A0A553PB64_TIGCA|nr:ER membrane protein complex subunit 8/9 homolog [Tigriopus californicus]TRY74889.1 hypothetical protein TCAL_04516 [Tigriopus californicus]|eukprot:TCALIF_04516-PA protein Name:"Similar to Emc8 ER membrane protein complex subunit 8 (Rattus norvegicus)" AED:0.01 eAED:0.01 QI:0/-1/0/1/-1/1/1/0/217
MSSSETSGEPALSFSCRAYAKMALHAAKYPHCAVNGVLLASKAQIKSLSTSSSSSSPKMLVVDAIPLSHQSRGLSPMLEMGLALTESLAEQEGLGVVGVYHVNELFHDISEDSFMKEVGKKIAENMSFSLVVTVDNQKLSLVMESHALIVRQCSGDKLKDVQDIILEGPTLEVVSTLLQRKNQALLNDFDNHLDDMGCDILNRDLNSVILQCLERLD